MKKQWVFMKSRVSIFFFSYTARWIQRVDSTIFKIVIHYIMKNFDPAGISIPGMIDSFCTVVIKPKILFFSRRTISNTTHYKEFTKFWQPLINTASASPYPVLMLYA